MTFLARRVLIALLMCSALVLSAAAQEGVTVSGSGVVGQAFSALVTDETITYNLNGTQNGVNDFCAGSSDITLANRPLTAAEASFCANTGVNFVELLIGFDGYALIASPDVDFLTCISINNLDALIAPSLSGTETGWVLLNSAYPNAPVEFVYTGLDSRPALLLDRVVRGEGFRSDATVLADNAAVIADVAAGAGKLGLISLSAAADAEGVKVLQLNNSSLGRCIEADAQNALDRQYSGGDRQFVYVNTAALEKAGVAEALAALVAPEAAAVLAENGFTALTEDLQAQAAAVVADGTAGRVFSREVSAYQVLGDTTGTLRVGSSASAISYLNAALATVTQRYANITLEASYLGAPAAMREYCNGNRDIIAVSGAFSEEELANCAANGITSYEVPLGTKAAVLIANADAGYQACLSTEAVSAVFGAAGASVKTWDAYDASFGADAIYLFVSSKSDGLLDVLLNGAPVRDDAQVNIDAQYRAVAVANTLGAVGLFSWSEAQDALEAQTGLQLVSLQAEGGECVAPSLETITDGSYPAVLPVRLVVNQRSLETTTVQAALYTMFSDENYRQLQDAGFVGITFASLVNVRADLIEAFNAADTAEAERFAEETAAQAEATEEAVVPEATEAP